MSLPVDVIPDPAQAFLSFALAYAVARVATPKLRDAALRFGVVDHPDGRLKNHGQPVAYFGGIAVALGVLVSLGVTYQYDYQLLATLLAGSTLLVLGLIDDLGSLTPSTKLAGQLLAAVVVVKAGIRIQLAGIPDSIELPVTVLWLVTITNAFNLIDIMDGLASGVGAIAALALGGLAAFNGMMSTAFLGFALAGSLLGFRRFNRHPATIYLGDTGSLLAGFLLGVLAITNYYTEANVIAAVAPLLILSVPLLDIALVTAIRLARRQSILRGSPDHVAIRLRAAGLSVPATVRTCVGVGSACALVGLGLTLASAAAALGMLIGAVAILLGFAAWLASVRVARNTD